MPQIVITSIDSAQLKVREHLDHQINDIYKEDTTLKMQSLLLSRDAQLHIHALSLPSLTVRRRNVVIPISHPARSQTQPEHDTPLFVWTESLLWNLVNTMELDAPCRGLRATAFKSMITAVAEKFQRQACVQFEESSKKGSFNLLQHLCSLLKKAIVQYKNRDEKKIKVISHCSSLLVLIHELRSEQLKDSELECNPTSSEQESPIQSASLNLTVHREAELDTNLGDSETPLLEVQRETLPPRVRVDSGFEGEPNIDVGTCTSPSFRDLLEEYYSRASDGDDLAELLSGGIDSYGEYFRSVYNEQLQGHIGLPVTETTRCSMMVAAERTTRWARRILDDWVMSYENRPPPAHHSYVPPVDPAFYDEEYQDYLQAIYDEV